MHRGGNAFIREFAARRNKILAEATSGDYSNVLYTCMERVEVR
jgi:hypothetical protein